MGRKIAAGEQRQAAQRQTLAQQPPPAQPGDFGRYLGGADRGDDARTLDHGASSVPVLVTIETSVRG